MIFSRLFVRNPRGALEKAVKDASAQIPADPDIADFVAQGIARGMYDACEGQVTRSFAPYAGISRSGMERLHTVGYQAGLLLRSRGAESYELGGLLNPLASRVTLNGHHLYVRAVEQMQKDKLFIQGA